MAIIDSVLADMDFHVKNANITKNITLTKLLNDKIITQEQYDDYSVNYNIIIIKPSWFEKWKKKFVKDDDVYRYKIVKLDNKDEDDSAD